MNAGILKEILRDLPDDAIILVKDSSGTDYSEAHGVRVGKLAFGEVISSDKVEHISIG